MTKRTYRQGRTARAPDARMTPKALEALKAILDKDGVSYADWLETKIMEDRKMNIKNATKLANDAIKSVTVDHPESVADTTVLFLNDDGAYSVTDNGEGVDNLDAENAVRIIVENLTS